ERLVVKTKSYTKEFIDEFGRPIMEDDYNYKVKVIHNEPVFYEWNGTELIELGSNYYLDQIDSLARLLPDSTSISNTIPSIHRYELEQNEVTVKNTNSDKKNSLMSISIGILIGGFVAGILFVLIGKKS